MKLQKHFLYLALAITGCVKPFEPESFSFEKVIVVDGQITDELTHHVVELSYTSPIGNEAKSPLRGATVWIEGSDGNTIPFVEGGVLGHYETVDEVAGEPGVSYQLFFTTTEEQHYESFPAVLSPSPAIDSLYTRYVEILSTELDFTTGGIQFFIDSHSDSEDRNYFLYTWDEYYKIITPYRSELIYVQRPDVFLDFISPRLTEQTICYEGKSSSQLLLASTTTTTENRIAEFPVRYISDHTDELRNRYTIEVKQYALDESAYSFYRKLKESSESGGSLFDKQQGSIGGNIRSIDDSKETVLGYFNVAGVSKIRKFYNPDDFDERYGPVEYRFPCSDDLIKTIPRDSFFFYLKPGTTNEIIDNAGGDTYRIIGKRCTSCTWFANTNPADFWFE